MLFELNLCHLSNLALYDLELELILHSMATQLGEVNSRTDDEHSIAEKRKAHHGVRLMLETEEVNRNQSSNPSNDDDEKMENEVNSEEPGSKTPSFFRKHASGLRSSMSSNFQWVPRNNSWSKWKPVIRCALAAWVSGVLFVIPKTENAMGQVCHVL